MKASARVRTFAGVLAILALLGGAATLALLAADVLRWERQVGRADAAYVSGAAAGETWQAATLLPSGLSRRLLGLGDDLAYRDALQQFWASKPRAPILRFEDVTKRSAAEREVARVVDEETDPVRRAQLLVLRGALLLEEARNSPVQREVFVRRAIDHLKRAATLEPSSVTALYDLELALKLLRRAGASQSQEGDVRSPDPDSGSGAATSGGGL